MKFRVYAFGGRVEGDAEEIEQRMQFDVEDGRQFASWQTRGIANNSGNNLPYVAEVGST